MFRHALAPLSCVIVLAACSGGEEREPAPISYQGTEPAARPSAPAAPLSASGPDARGVVYNDGYETIIARNGDTVDTVAARVGITGAELSAYNGLPTTYRPQAGDELVLPAKPGGYRTGTTAVAVATPQLAPTSTVPTPTPIETAAIGAAPAPAATAPAASGSTWSASSIAAAIDGSTPQQSTLEPANEPVAAAPAATAAPAPAPTPVPQPVPAAPTPQPTPVLVEPVQQASTAPVTAPAPTTPAPTTSNARFVSPVDAAIARPFSKLPGPNRNDGVDFASPAGMEVRAADAGTVALVSKSLGGLGTIVLVRHSGGLLTVYGRVDGVSVKKGDTLARGQTFARVADLPAPREPSLHFEVRRGAESVDPAGFI